MIGGTAAIRGGLTDGYFFRLELGNNPKCGHIIDSYRLPRVDFLNVGIREFVFATIF